MKDIDIVALANEIMIDKLQEMSQLDISDFVGDSGAYNGCCSVMCDIYKALMENNK